MEFNETLAKQTVKRNALEHYMIKLWRQRGKIPNRYSTDLAPPDAARAKAITQLIRSHYLKRGKLREAIGKEAIKAFEGRVPHVNRNLLRVTSEIFDGLRKAISEAREGIEKSEFDKAADLLNHPLVNMAGFVPGFVSGSAEYHGMFKFSKRPNTERTSDQQVETKERVTFHVNELYDMSEGIRLHKDCTKVDLEVRQLKLYL